MQELQPAPHNDSFVSEVACHPDWESISVDVEKAFLQGLTYKELAKMTGEPERIVHFT